MKQIRLINVLAIGLLVMSGCDNSSDDGVVSFWAYQPSTQAHQNAFRDLIADFTVETGIKVKLNLVVKDSFNTALNSALNGRSKPDLSYLDQPLIADYASDGTIYDTKPNNNAEKIGLISLELSQNEVSSYSATRIEAEATTISGGTIKGEGDLGNGNWSGSSYVGGMGTKNVLMDPSQITVDLSNINYLSFSYTATNVGTYDVYLRYASGLDCTSYVRANQGNWYTLNLISASYWDTPRVTRATINMQAGTQTIVVTGTTNNGGWANYDFIDIVQRGSLTDEEVAINYATFFRDQTSAGCTAANVSLIPWAQLKSEYQALSGSAKDAFVASTNGLALDAKARYQVLINKYPTLASDNWLVNSEGDPIYSSEIINNTMTFKSTTGLIIGIAIIVISTIGLAFTLLRKRKFNY